MRKANAANATLFGGKLDTIIGQQDAIIERLDTLIGEQSSTNVTDLTITVDKPVKQ